MAENKKNQRKMRKVPTQLPDDLFIRHAKEIEKILRTAVRRALLVHKKLGNPVAIWKNGRVVIVPPEKIPSFRI